jgi:hypothetical protein
MRYGLYEEGRLTAPGRRPWLVVVAKGSGPAAPEEARPNRTQEVGRSGQLLVGLALLGSSLISLTVLVLLVRLIASL